MSGHQRVPVTAHVAVTGDVPRLLSFLGLHAVPGLETWDGARYARVLPLPGGVAALEVAVAAGGAHVRVHGACPDDVPLALVAAGHLLGAGDDPGPAEATLAADPVLRPLVAARPGLCRPGSVDHAETLLRTVVGQQVSLAAARTVTGRLVAGHGEALPPAAAAVGGLARAFPTPEALAGADPATFPMPRSRGRCLVAVAAAVAADPGVLEDHAALLALPGVGPWTVAYHRLRARRDPDVFLAGDLAVRRQLEHLGAAGSPREVADRAARWAPHRSTALMHLWTDLLERRAAA